MKEELGTIITIWLAFFVSRGNDSSAASDALTQDEADEKNQNVNLIATAAAFCSAPVFGFLTDKLSTGHELIVAFGLRGATALAFFNAGSPRDMHVTATLVTMMLAANLEEVVIDSMYTKRIPSDVRAAMKSAQTAFGKLGHLTFVAFSLVAIGTWTVGELMLVVALFDFSVVLIAIFVSLGGGFAEDEETSPKAKLEKAQKAL